MADDRLDVDGLLESVEEEGTPETEDGKFGRIGARAGAAIGAVVGRKLGAIVGERVIDDLVLGQEQSTDASEDTDDEPREESGDDAQADEPDEDDGASTEEPGDGIEAVEDLDELSYRDLQKLAKEVDVKANLKREEMTDRIAEALELDS